jgi:hypothetical protein
MFTVERKPLCVSNVEKPLLVPVTLKLKTRKNHFVEKLCGCTKPAVCNQCRKSFSSSRYLKCMKRTDISEKPYI